MYIDPGHVPTEPRPGPAEDSPGGDRIKPPDVDEARAAPPPANTEDEADEFECVCHIHVETRDGRTFYRLVLERE